MARILVTGAGGFIGRSLCPVLAARGHRVAAGLRRAPQAGTPPIAGAEETVIGDILPDRDWRSELRDIDIVVHLAQRAHRRESERALAQEPEAAAALARAAALLGVRRLLYVSSIKAMGERTAPGRPFRAEDGPCPEDAYGRTKIATEQALAAAATDTGLEVAIVRPPLVYGPGVSGNFRALLRLAGSGLPLPFAEVENRRSLIAVENLADLLASAVEHPAAAGRVLLAHDGTDLSTPALIRILAAAQHRPARLFAAPNAVLTLLRGLPAVGPALSRLTQSLQVDDGATRATLGWRPPVAVETALLATGSSFAADRTRRRERRTRYPR